MNTPTHILAAAAILSDPGNRLRNSTVLLGGLLPDLSIFVLFGWARLQGVPQWEIWRELYWQEPWQTLSAISNSFPIWLAILATALALRSGLVIVLAGAVLIHLCLDFPVHADDAHKHFWPLTDWRFHSPLSYWDPNHNSRFVVLGELALCLVAIVVLWRKFSSSLWVRGALFVALVSLALVPLFFWLTLG